MLITAFLYIWPEGHQEPRNKVGSPSLAKRLVGIEPGVINFHLKLYERVVQIFF